ncbi:universal stress protein [Natronomonas sp.]|uniref:universal stress protein n=1 Tax=Natronomonas sp. TaxID=2184060 RepID=UPI002FC30E2C
MSQPIRSILVPTDGSEGAEIGARRGVDLAASIGADLHVLSAVDIRETEPALSNLSADDKLEQEQLLEEQAERAVDTVVRLARSHISGRITTTVEQRTPVRAITDYADTHDIDLIVMGTHGRSDLEQVLLGSVAEKTLRTSSVPVVTVPPSADIEEVGEAVYDDILLPTDGSEGSEAAVELALAWADVYDATLHTLYSVDTSRFAGVDERSQIHDALEETGREALETVRERARESGVSVAGNIGNGPAARVIRSYSEEHDIDMVVMGTHGRSGVKRYLIGSVTETVVRTADIPICCVPMEEL